MLNDMRGYDMAMSRGRRLDIVGAILFLLSACPSFNATNLPPIFLNRVVAIGRTEMSPGPLQGQWVAEASGFLYGDFVAKVNEKENNYALYLVTNRHVIEDHVAATAGPMVVKST